MKASWLSWLAVLLAATALIISFVFIGQAKDTTADLELAMEAYNATLDQYNEVIDQYNEVIDDYNQAAEEFNQVIEDYWQWRAEQNAT